MRRAAVFLVLIGFTTGLIGVFILAAGSAQAQRPDLEVKFAPIVAEICGKLPNAIECFTESASMTYAMCGLVSELAVVGAKDGHGRFRRCVSDARTNIAPPFERARKATATNKEASALLKDAYSYWLTAIDGLMPGLGETNLTYRNRLAQQKETLGHKMNRLKLEK